MRTKACQWYFQWKQSRTALGNSKHMHCMIRKHHGLTPGPHTVSRLLSSDSIISDSECWVPDTVIVPKISYRIASHLIWSSVWVLISLSPHIPTNSRYFVLFLLFVAHDSSLSNLPRALWVLRALVNLSSPIDVKKKSGLNDVLVKCSGNLSCFPRSPQNLQSWAGASGLETLCFSWGSMCCRDKDVAASPCKLVFFFQTPVQMCTRSWHQVYFYSHRVYGQQLTVRSLKVLMAPRYSSCSK